MLEKDRVVIPVIVAVMIDVVKISRIGEAAIRFDRTVFSSEQAAAIFVVHWITVAATLTCTAHRFSKEGFGVILSAQDKVVGKVVPRAIFILGIYGTCPTIQIETVYAVPVVPVLS